MKILHVVQGYTPAIGGTELVIQKLSERLVQKYNDEVTVFTTNAAKNCQLFWSPKEPTVPVGMETINGVAVRRFPVFSHLGHARHQLSKIADRLRWPYRDRLRALFNGPIIFGMTREIARFGADLILASSFPFLHMHYALTGGKRSGKPVALIGALHTGDAWGFERPMIYQAIRQAAAYIAYTTYEQNYLVARKIDPHKITTIGAGIDLASFAVQKGGSNLRADYGWGQAPVVGFVGQLAKRKGVHHLLGAMPAVWAAFPEVKLLLAGGHNDYVEQLEREAKKLSAGDPNRVVVTKNFQEKEKATIFSACDLLVFPSSEESFGIVFLEAWACRKPVIGLRAGPIPSLIDEGLNGLLVDPVDPAQLAQAICRLVANPSLSRQLGQAGYQKVKRDYTWDIVTDKFRAVYADLIRN